jgi:hypothetical protein
VEGGPPPRSPARRRAAVSRRSSRIGRIRRPDAE